MNPVAAGALISLIGPEHVRRRRTLNQLLRADALTYYHRDILMPALDRILARIARDQYTDGVCRADLVHEANLLMLRFSCELLGLIGIDTDERANEVLGILRPVHAAMLLNFSATDQQAVIADAEEAIARFSERFFRPSIRFCENQLKMVQDGKLPSDSVPNNLMRLVATRAVPEYSDERFAIAETLTLLNASIGTSARQLVLMLDEFWRWMEGHPEDTELVGNDDFLVGIVYETIRLYANSVPILRRVALEDVTLSTGKTIAEGELLAILHVRADRDSSIFGSDADTCNPHRQLAPGVAPYGLGFGGGPHMCLGLRVVLGNEGVGSHLLLLKGLLAAGIEPDRDRPPTRSTDKVTDSEHITYASYPVVFRNLSRNRSHDRGDRNSTPLPQGDHSAAEG